MGIVNLTQNLENFGLTDYGNVGKKGKGKGKGSTELPEPIKEEATIKSIPYAGPYRTIKKPTGTSEKTSPPIKDVNLAKNVTKNSSKEPTNLSQIGGRHGGTKVGGLPPHPKDHSELDDGAGVPQTFYDGHSSIVTGQQTFERPNPKSLEQMVSNFGPLETEPETRGPYGVTDYMDGTKQGQGFIPPGGHPLGFTVDME